MKAFLPRHVPALTVIALAAGLSLFAVHVLGDNNVANPKIVQQPESFTVVGISARTNNAKEMTADGVIGKSWQRFFQEGLLSKIPNKVDGNIVAVYTAYATDHNGDYTYLLGAKVKDAAEVPAGMVAKTVPAGKYAVFTTERGPSYQVVPQAWEKINHLPKSAIGGDRVYRADYEIYDERAKDPQSAVVDIFIGIK